MDTVRTGSGRVKIVFVDQSTVSITEQSKLVIDSFVYDGNPKTSRMALKFASGTVRFATGQKGIINKSNINLRTPTATIAVRGTDFVSTVDDFGKSLIILLPEEDGSVGEITVSNAAGSVILNKAFQATTVETYDTSPSMPIILNMSLDMLDNMLIVNPPPIAENLDQQSDNRSNILDLSELDIDYLKNNDLEKDNLSGTELDVQTIDANFLQDYLSDPLTGLRETRDGVSIEGTTFGFNAETQIYTILSGVSLRFIRSVNNNQDITVPKDQGTTLIINDAGKATTLIVNDGGSIIIVNQKN
tara:strand:+ start:4645 stop:5550 length:906 start_codon:yes stop_codon:yes gene_type:complete